MTVKNKQTLLFAYSQNIVKPIKLSIMRVLVFYKVGGSHPWDYRFLDGDELFNELVNKEHIVRMYLVDACGQLEDFERDYNSEFFDHNGFWCQLVNVSVETYNNYKNR